MRENLTESGKFSAPEVAGLRNSMLQEVLDLRAAAEVLQLFLMGRGYGVSTDEAREAVGRFGVAGWPVEAIQRELNRIALVQ
jgi:hypothetical protein